MIGSGRRRGIHYRHIGRYGEIVSVFVKYGFGDLLARVGIERYIRAGRRIFRVKQAQKLDYYSRWDRVRMALEELGPTFIKLGQFASNRPDMLPADLIESLEKLQDAVPPFSEDESVRTIEQELKRPISELFREFTRTPIASASIAQVHRAMLKDGQRVAVKVRRPRITDTIAVDLEILYHLASLVEKHVSGADVFNPIKLVDEFSRAIEKEIDFTTEALHITRFTQNFKNDPHVYIPKVYTELTTQSVIITEFIDGIKITNVKELREAGLDPKLVAQRGAQVVLKQIFIHGFFHADPHPGNILVKEDNVICFLDMGMAGILSPSSREKLGVIIVGLANDDPQRIARLLYEMSEQRIGKREDLEYEIAELIQEYGSRTLGAMNIREILNRLAGLFVTHRLHLIPGFYLLVKALVTMEGIGYKLDPNFNMMEHLEPFARKLIQQQYSPSNLIHESYDSLQEFGLLLRDMPYETREIFQLIKTGRVHIEFEHRGLDPIMRKLDQMVNRLVYSLVLAALVIGSSVVVLSNIPPKFHGLPVFGVVGFVVSGIMGFLLLISILQHERL